MKSTVKRIIVVGGGFAGINFIRKISDDKRFQITLVDRNNYHFFPPLIYQVATAFIEPSNISYPFRRLFQKKDNLRFHMGSLLRIDAEAQKIVTDTGELLYDILVLAFGTETNFFGMENVKKHAFPLKSINDALNLRNYLLLNFERAVQADNLADREQLLNIVIAGGGPTGVEVAGMLGEMGHTIVKKEYPEFKFLKPRIHIVDAGPVLLGPMRKKSQEEALRVLSALDVQMKFNTAVKDFDGERVTLADGSTIATNMLIWASGVTTLKVAGLPDSVYAKGNRIMVNEFNGVEGFHHIYALGDMCMQTNDSRYEKGHPQLAQVAIQQGRRLAQNLRLRESGQPMVPFIYKDKGSMAIITKYKAVADLPKFSFRGFFAWMVWLFIHLLPIAGFRNKFQLVFNWFWAFITNDPTLRLIIRPDKRKNVEQ